MEPLTKVARNYLIWRWRLQSVVDRRCRNTKGKINGSNAIGTMRPLPF